MKTLIIVNPKAREGEVERRWPEMERELLAALGEKSARVAFTSASDYGSGVTRAALRDGVERIVVVGGDGTIAEVVQGFFENGQAIAPAAALAIMPAGRGDDFFKSVRGAGRIYSSKEGWQQGLELLRTGEARPADLGRITLTGAGGSTRTKYFINIASFGYPGLVVKRVVAHAGLWGRSRLGKSAWTYLLQSAGALKDYRPIQVAIAVDGKEFYRGPLFSGFVLNGCYNAGGVRWSADSRIDDGLFHVLAFEPRDVLATALTSSRMLSGDWKGVRGVHVTSGRKVEIRADGPRFEDHPLFEIDGDLPEPPGTHSAAVEIMAGALRIVR